MNLNELRHEIDEIDDLMMALFKRRMEVSKDIGKVKRAMNLPIFDPARETLILEKRRIKLNDEEIWPAYRSFLTKLFDLSKEWQHHE